MENSMQIWIALALVGSVASANIPEAPPWQKDYHSAKVQAKDVQKPLAVFIGSGKDGWSKLTYEDTFDPKLNHLLATRYVCVYADRSTPAGKRLADAFEVTDGTGLVISDKSGSVQAYHHSGELSRTDLTATLEKYSDTTRTVQFTESAVPVRYYQPAPVYYQPQPVVIPYRSIGGG